jgi:purine-binding chemotaxis protein CheW
METLKDRRETGELRQFISFSVGEEEYGLELLRVKEVIRIREITWLPKAPTFVKGIINLRGDVIPIIDLRDKFGLESRENTASTRVIVVEVDTRLMGMVVDSASQVVRIPADQIDPPPPVLGGFSKEFITGVGKLDDKLIILLNTDAILTIEELEALGTIDSAARAAADSSAPRSTADLAAPRSTADLPAEEQPAGSRA